MPILINLVTKHIYLKFNRLLRVETSFATLTYDQKEFPIQQCSHQEMYSQHFS